MALADGLVKIVGPEHVSYKPDVLDACSRDESFAAPVKPKALVRPENADEVQAIVKWANETTTPLVPVSSGAPHFRGDTVPGVPGALIVDLSRMKRIMEVDRRNKIAIIEPGVTWTELQPYLAKDGLTLPMPLLPRSSKSVIASLLEREPMVIPKYHWTMLEPLRCCEIVWGNGDRMWTGEAGDQTGSLEERRNQFLYQVNPMGPYQTDFYRFVSAAQGSMGIVVCASLKCEVLPQVHKLLFVPSENPAALIDFAYKILRRRYGYELLILNGANLASIMEHKTGRIKSLSESLPRWVLILGLAGLKRLPEERIKLQENEINDIARDMGLRLDTAIPGDKDRRLGEILDRPSDAPYWKLRYKGNCQDIFFITTLDRAPEFVGAMYSLCGEAGYPVSDMGIYIQPVMQGVACHCEFSLPFAPDNRQELDRVKKLVIEGSKALMAQGAFFSRPYGSWADMVYGTDEQTTAVLKKIKGIFDPNNIMNPGKLCF